MKKKNILYLYKISRLFTNYMIRMIKLSKWFSFPRVLMFPQDEIEESIEIRGKTELTTSRGNRHVLLYSDERNTNNIHIQQLYFVNDFKI